MTIQQAMALQLQQITSQLGAYQADITNLLALIQNLSEQQAAITAWLATNPG